MFRKKGLDAAKIPLCASVCLLSAETRVTSVKSFCSQSFVRVSGALSVDSTEIILSKDSRHQSFSCENRKKPTLDLYHLYH